MPNDDVVIELQAIPGSEFTCRVPMTLPLALYRSLEARYDKAVNVDGMPCPLCRDARDTLGVDDPEMGMYEQCAACRFVKALWAAGVPDDELAGMCQCMRLLPRLSRKVAWAGGRPRAGRFAADEAAMDEALRVLHAITVKIPDE